MLPFRIDVQPGEPAHAQIVFAATRAIVTGALENGARFPSVRELSRELRINPNTAHKVVATLVRDGLLDVLPGIGTVVAPRPPGDAESRKQLLRAQVEELVVEAKRLGLSRKDVGELWDECWRELQRAADGSTK